MPAFAQSKSDIGFGKKLRRAWLDLALEHVARGESFEEAKAALADAVRAENSGVDAIRKVLTSIKRVWFTPPSYCLSTRNAGIELYRRKRKETALLLHWGMSMAAYPFVGAVAESVGRLLRLQDSFAIADVKRRLGERFGERGFVDRIVRYDLSSFLEWGVVAETGKKGVYAGVRSIVVGDEELTAWLIEALLHTRVDGALPIAQARQNPSLFPFELELPGGAKLAANNPRLQAIRHAHTDELLTLKGG